MSTDQQNEYTKYDSLSLVELVHGMSELQGRKEELEEAAALHQRELRDCERRAAEQLLQAFAAERYGVVQYVVPRGEALTKAKELAKRICQNAPLSNFAITNSLPRIQDMGYDDGLFFERMVAEYTRSPESITRLKQFLDKTAPRLRMPD